MPQLLVQAPKRSLGHPFLVLRSAECALQSPLRSNINLHSQDLSRIESPLQAAACPHLEAAGSSSGSSRDPYSSWAHRSRRCRSLVARHGGRRAHQTRSLSETGSPVQNCVQERPRTVQQCNADSEEPRNIIGFYTYKATRNGFYMLLHLGTRRWPSDQQSLQSDM